ncbi:MAG: LysR family transcriptional regulator [Burkholderiales bacterium]|nr:LysR family transcriptional regulator [Burkholderiales bacterium]
MDRFLSMQALVAVVDAGSFVAAADALGVSKAGVSRRVADLETHLGVRLLHRNTRRVAATPEGLEFAARARDLLAGLDEAEAAVAARDGEVDGLLRVNAPVSFGVRHLAPLWGRFAAAQPRVRLDVSLVDRRVDPVEEGFDVSIRIARLPDSRLIARTLATTRLVVCASPGYLARHGTPRTPEALRDHAVIGYSYWSERDDWRFVGPRGPVEIRTRPWMHANNGDTCRAVALDDGGIVLQPTFLVGEDLRAGRLVELLPDFALPRLGVHALWPSRRHTPLKVRRFVDFLVAALQPTPWPD